MGEQFLLSEKYKVFLKHDAARHLFPDDYKYKDRLISRCARGQVKTAYGYKWEYAE